MTWPRRAVAPAATVNDQGNDKGTLIACPHPDCDNPDAFIESTITRLTGVGMDGIERHRYHVTCRVCELAGR